MEKSSSRLWFRYLLRERSRQRHGRCYVQTRLDANTCSSAYPNRHFVTYCSSFTLTLNLIFPLCLPVLCTFCLLTLHLFTLYPCFIPIISPFSLRVFILKRGGDVVERSSSRIRILLHLLLRAYSSNSIYNSLPCHVPSFIHHPFSLRMGSEFAIYWLAVHVHAQL